MLCGVELKTNTSAEAPDTGVRQNATPDSQTRWRWVRIGHAKRTPEFAIRQVGNALK